MTRPYHRKQPVPPPSPPKDDIYHTETQGSVILRVYHNGKVTMDDFRVDDFLDAKNVVTAARDWVTKNQFK